jgi:drug/metabolite transporter (DMT)-like permease
MSRVCRVTGTAAAFAGGMSASTLHGAAPGEARRHLTGVGLIVCAVTCFSCLDASAKWLNQSLPPLQTVTVRYLGSFFFTVIFLNPWSRPGILRTRHPRLQIARAVCLVIATLSVFSVLHRLPLAQVTAIGFATPLIVALLAGPALGEKIGPRRLAAVGVGFAGVLVVTRPFGGAMDPAAFMVLITASANAVYSLLTRRIAAHDRPETTLFYTGLVGSALVLPLVPFTWTTPTSPATWIAFVTMSGAGALGHGLLIVAHKYAPASLLAPFYYIQLVGSATLGRVVFGETPDRWTVIGGAIVIGSGLYLLYRERVRHKYPSADVPA